ncbi:phage portal protein [Streptomyces sp. SID3343]|uniref:phage portal protein n=1 Tax=Streptomyces sp. SID3343 TaxID=2690260 RepID=UPI00137163F0|nr:phage portal protein [Streptomyces sp. SID3343]MYW03472.1 phage portal protein [Streptomyces sp. SID3343]
MPLPEGGDQPWPPTDPVVQTALADWDAWYSGDPDRLADRYTNRVHGEPRDRPSQHRGGMVGRVARWWWGQPSPLGERRAKLHVPLAGDIARTSSNLLFSEPPSITAPGEDAATQARIDELIEGGLHATLLEAGEVASALGGAYLRVVWDDQVDADHAWIGAVHADAAIPELRYGRLQAATFWTVVQIDGQAVLRHLERHERGHILHGLYAGSVNTLGKRVDLAAHPATASIAKENPDGVIDTGAPHHLTAAYVPNIRPARAWRHVPSAAYWGQSDLQGIEGILDGLDETWSSWMRDIRNGKGRVIAANYMLQSNGPGQGASFEDREIYSGLDMLPGQSDGSGLEVVQFEIRVQQHRDTCTALVEQAVRQAGYSAATFGVTGDGAAVTATEIRARERQSMTTRARKALLWKAELARIVEALLAVEAGTRFRSGDLVVDSPRVEFQDSISEDPKTLAETANLLMQAEAASTEIRVRTVHPDWDTEQVDQEVAAILRESGRMAADPTTVGADIPPPEPDDPEAEPIEPEPAAPTFA